MSNTFRSDPFALDEDIAPLEEGEKPANFAPDPPKPDPVPAPVRAPETKSALSRSNAPKTGKKRGRPVSANPKRQITLRLDADIISHFKSKGRGWQTRINESLRKELS